MLSLSLTGDSIAQGIPVALAGVTMAGAQTSHNITIFCCSVHSSLSCVFCPWKSQGSAELTRPFVARKWHTLLVSHLHCAIPCRVICVPPLPEFGSTGANPFPHHPCSLRFATRAVWHALAFLGTLSFWYFWRARLQGITTLLLPA